MIPLATTTVAVWRLPADPDRDGYDTPPARQQVKLGLRAHIGSPSGRHSIADGRTVTTFRLDTDPFDFAIDDQIQDESTGEVYMLAWARKRVALGLDHVEGAMYLIEGALTEAGS